MAVRIHDDETRLVDGERLAFVETRPGEPVFGARPALTARHWQ